jgi:hypothetical protein
MAKKTLLSNALAYYRQDPEVSNLRSFDGGAVEDVGREDANPIFDVIKTFFFLPSDK